MPLSAAAADRYWVGGNFEYGYEMWYLDANWEDDEGNPGVPLSGDNVYITSPVSQAAFNVVTDPLGLLSIDNNSVLTFVGFGHLYADYTEVGGLSQGTIYMDWGSHNISGDLNLGVNYGSRGDYIMGSGTLNVGGSTNVGLDGTGVFTQYGGTHSTGALILTNGYDGSGTYNLVDGELYTDFTLVGSQGTGYFVQGADPDTGDITAGGTHTVDGDLVMGIFGNDGYYALVNGDLNVSGWTIMGDDGNGYFNQYDGNFTLAGGSGELYLGYSEGGYGRYEMYGGTLSAGWLYAGYEGTSDFVQDGGTVTVASEMNVGTYSYGTYGISGEGVLDAGTATLYIGRWAGGLGAFNQGGGTVTADWMDVGSEGEGTVTHWNGNATVNNALVIGRATGATGTYLLIPGGESVSLATGETVVGAYGSGTFEQQGGTHATGTLILGYNTGGNGTYELSGGDLLSDFQRIGLEGSGTFNQTGGTNTAAVLITLGQEAAAYGEYHLSGDGSVIVIGDSDLINGWFGVGSSGSGCFMQEDGSVIVNGFMTIGSMAGSTGAYELTGGSLSVRGSEVKIGDGGTGTFTQTGGDVTFGGAMYLGDDYTSEGTYTMQGGTLSGEGLCLGEWGGKGYFYHSAGEVTLDNLKLARQELPSKSYGYYELSGSGVLRTVYEELGILGDGYFRQTGGSHEVSDSLYIARSSGTGTYELTFGSLTTGSTVVGCWDGGAGTFIQTGGTHVVGAESSDWLIVGNWYDTTGTYNMSGASSVLTVTGAEYVGSGGVGTFSQAGGTHTVNGNLIVGEVATTGNGTFNLGGSSSSLTVNGRESIGMDGNGVFNQAGGTHAVNGDLIIAEFTGSTGTYNFSGGSLTAGRIVVNQGGLFKGAGSITAGSFEVNGGTIAPGNSPGTLTIQGGYSQSAEGILEVELGSLTDYDILNITGTADLAGTLRVLLFESYNPEVGNTFDILMAYTINDTFDALVGPSGWNWMVAYLDTDGLNGIDTVRLTASAVPIPPTVWIFGSALLGLIGIRMRFRQA